jgi:hypothetical protein
MIFHVAYSLCSKAVCLLFELPTLRVSKFKSGQRRLILLWCHSTEKEVIIGTRSSLLKLTCTKLFVEEQIWWHINVLYSWYQWIEAVYYFRLLPRFRDTCPRALGLYWPPKMNWVNIQPPDLRLNGIGARNTHEIMNLYEAETWLCKLSNGNQVLSVGRRQPWHCRIQK